MRVLKTSKVIGVQGLTGGRARYVKKTRNIAKASEGMGERECGREQVGRECIFDKPSSRCPVAAEEWGVPGNPGRPSSQGWVVVNRAG